MNGGEPISSLHPSRPVGPDVRLDVLPLTLDDGYVTPMFRFTGGENGEEKGGRLPAGRQVQIFATAAETKKPPFLRSRLPVLYVHGIQSHPGWFSASACHLARQGHTVYVVTRRGSGCNTRARGDAPSAIGLIDDVVCACELAKADSGQSRIHLLGVSWGGKLLSAVLARGRLAPAAASLTLVAPGLVSRVDVPLGQKLAIAWAMVTRPDRLFDIPLSDVELFTANPEMQEYLRRDPLRLHQAAARFLVASRRLDRMVATPMHHWIDVPATLILAETDRIIDKERTRGLLGRLTIGEPRVIVLPGHHTLEFEPDVQPLLRALAESLAMAER